MIPKTNKSMKFFKRLLVIAIALATLVALFYTWTNWWGARKLNAALAMLQEKNEPTQLEQLMPPPVPDALNVAAAPVFEGVFPDSRGKSRIEKDLPSTIPGKPESGESRIHFIARSLHPDFKGDDQAAGELVLESLAPSAPLLEEIAQAVRRPGVCWPLDYSKGLMTPVPHITLLLRSAQVFQRRALAELAAGRPENAFADVQTLLKLASAAGSDPLIIAKLLEMSILHIASTVISDGLDRHSWSDAQLAEFSSELLRIDLLTPFTNAFRTESVVVLQIDPKSLDSLLPELSRNTAHRSALLRFASAIRPNGWFNASRAELIGFHQRVIAALESPEEFPSTVTTLEDDFVRNPGWIKIRNPIISRMVSPLLGSVSRCAYTQTILQSLGTACAVERYRLAHGRLPEALQYLVPAFLASVPADPLTGQPLHYKLTDTGSALIYGTGWNQMDDAGSGVGDQPEKGRVLDMADWGVQVKF